MLTIVIYAFAIGAAPLALGLVRELATRAAGTIDAGRGAELPTLAEFAGLSTLG